MPTLDTHLTWEEIVRRYQLTLDHPARKTQASYNACARPRRLTPGVARDGKAPARANALGQARGSPGSVRDALNRNPTLDRPGSLNWRGNRPDQHG